jgi:hypothetical protein
VSNRYCPECGRNYGDCPVCDQPSKDPELARLRESLKEMGYRLDQAIQGRDNAQLRVRALRDVEQQAEAERDRLKDEIRRLSERLRLRQDQAEVERDELLGKWEILAERTLVASALLDEFEPDLEAELAPHRSGMLRKVLAGEAGRDDLLPILVPKLAEAERQRAEQAEQAEQAEAAMLRAGESDETPEPGAELTPGQWIYQWNRLTAQQRLTKIEGLFHMLDIGNSCLIHGHDDLRLELDAANLRIRELTFGSLAERLNGQVLAVRQLAQSWAELAGPALDLTAVVDPKVLATWYLSECGRAVLVLLDQPKDATP